jgi:hypothetical protein
MKRFVVYKVLLAAAPLAAVGYEIYEYQHDLANQFIYIR